LNLGMRMVSKNDMMGKGGGLVAILSVLVLVGVVVGETVEHEEREEFSFKAYETYLEQREHLMYQRSQLSRSSETRMSEEELAAGRVLHKLRKQDLQTMLHRLPWEFNFYDTKSSIDTESVLFPLIETMPKSAVLHLHFNAAVSFDWYVYNVTYRRNCYLFVEVEVEEEERRLAEDTDDFLTGVYSRGDFLSRLERTGMRSWGSLDLAQIQRYPSPRQAGYRPIVGGNAFFDQPPGRTVSRDGLGRISSITEWVPMNTLRKLSPDPAEFDRRYLRSLTMEDFQGLDYFATWGKFTSIFGRMYSGIFYDGVFYEFFNHIVESLVDDHVYHAEFRLDTFAETYALNGTVHPAETTYDLLLGLQKWYRETYNFSFILICQGSKGFSLEEARNDLRGCHDFHQKYGGLVRGYDLAGPEDDGHSWLYYSPIFTEYQARVAASGEDPLKYYFHAGETLLINNTNVLDAFALRADRLGHGFALSNNPAMIEPVLEAARRNNFALEVNPISNQLLQFFGDIRAHPAIGLFLSGVPVTISSDDPGIWGYSGVSYDFYQIYCAWRLSLTDLKTIFMDATRYSALDEVEQKILEEHWLIEWGKWIARVNSF